MDNKEVEVFNTQIIVEIVEYVSKSLVIRTIIGKTKGNISAVSFEIEEELVEKTISSDTFVQIIDGKVDIIIDGISNVLDTGQFIIIPAFTSNIARADNRFKMISTTIEGYAKKVI